VKLAERIGRLGAESAFDVLVKARGLEALGRSIVHLEIGEPDFPTPPHIVEAAKRALDEGWTHYGPTQGLPELREAIASYISRTRGIPVGPQQVAVVPGGKPIIFFPLIALVEPGDEVIYPNPGFPIYESMIRFLGAKPVAMPLVESRGFSIDLDLLYDRLTDRTKLVILNAPQNPTGGVIPREDLRAISEMLANRDVMVLSDEIYSRIHYGDEPPVSITAFPSMLEKTIILDGFSKTYAMTGWRIGYAGGPEPLINAMRKVMSQTTSNPSSISQWAAVEALNGTQAFIKPNARLFEERRDLVVSMLNQARGMHCPTPEGAFYVYPSVEGLVGKTAPSGKVIQTDEDFCVELLEAEGVSVVFGAAFGLSPFFRISYATANEVLEDACTRIQRFCGAVK